jgi:hypothetical protein
MGSGTGTGIFLAASRYSSYPRNKGPLSPNRAPSGPQQQGLMKRAIFTYLPLFVGAFACSQQESSLGPTTDLTGTVFDYWLAFSPSDSVFGGGGRVRGEGASWTMSPTGAFVVELSSSPVEGSMSGNTRLDIVLTQFPVDSGNVPLLGQYQVGPAGQAFNGRAWLRDNVRTWASNSVGIVVLNEWLPDGSLQGQVALRVVRDQAGTLGGVVEQEVSVVGTFILKRLLSSN